MWFGGVGLACVVTQVWRMQLKRIRSWGVRLFFAATVGFSLPVTAMAQPAVVAQGVLLGIVGGLLPKLLSSLTVSFRRGLSEAEVRQERAASLLTRSGHVQPSQLMVGAAMTARGEFSFLIAERTRNTLYRPSLVYGAGTPRYAMNEDVYGVVLWALLIATVLAPQLVRWSIAVYKRGRVARTRGARSSLDKEQISALEHVRREAHEGSRSGGGAAGGSGAAGGGGGSGNGSPKGENGRRAPQRTAAIAPGSNNVQVSASRRFVLSLVSGRLTSSPSFPPFPCLPMSSPVRPLWLPRVAAGGGYTGGAPLPRPRDGDDQHAARVGTRRRGGIDHVRR